MGPSIKSIPRERTEPEKKLAPIPPHAGIFETSCLRLHSGGVAGGDCDHRHSCQPAAASPWQRKIRKWLYTRVGDMTTGSLHPYLDNKDVYLCLTDKIDLSSSNPRRNGNTGGVEEGGLTGLPRATTDTP